MRFVGVRVDSSNGAAAVILDMLLKFGVIVYKDDETWALHKFAKVRRLYCLAIGRQSRTALRLSTSWATGPYPLRTQGSKRKSFLEAFDQVMFLPGDWHTGWTSCSPSINCSGPICWILCGITLDGRWYPRMCNNATTKHRDWWNMPTMLCRRISCVPSFLVTCWNTMSECMMFLLVICCVSLCQITKSF